MEKNWSLATFLILITALCGLTWFYTGGFAPPSGDASIWFYGGLFALLVAKFVTEYRFTKPNDAVVNCVTAFVALSTLTSPPNPDWWELLRWSAFVCGTLALMVAWDLRRTPIEERGLSRRLVYGLVTRFGSAEVLTSLVFVLSVISYFDAASESTRVFVIFWGVVLLLANLDLGAIASQIRPSARRGRRVIGVAHSFLSPTIVYCSKADSEPLTPHQLVGFSRSSRTDAGCFGVIIDERSSVEETLVSVALLNTTIGAACIDNKSLMIRLNDEEIERARRALPAGQPEDLTKIAGTVAAGPISVR